MKKDQTGEEMSPTFTECSSSTWEKLEVCCKLFREIFWIFLNTLAWLVQALNNPGIWLDLGPGKLLELWKSAKYPGILKLHLENDKMSLKNVKIMISKMLMSAMGKILKGNH